MVTIHLRGFLSVLILLFWLWLNFVAAFIAAGRVTLVAGREAAMGCCPLASSRPIIYQGCVPANQPAHAALHAAVTRLGVQVCQNAHQQLCWQPHSITPQL
jgi:hypothetical protein